jgi:hypothetical protein
MNTETSKNPAAAGRKKSLLGRILKWTGISLLVIIILLALIPVLFKDKIVAIVKEQANKNLNAKVDFGDFDLGLIASFPDFRFSMDNLSVIGVNEFANDTLAYIKHLKTDINLKSVLSGGTYKINSIIIDAPRILAKVLPNGKANWDIAKTDSSAAQTPEDTSATKFSMSLKDLKINDAYIVYDDQEGKMYSRIENLDYDMKGDFTQDVFDMKNKAEIEKLTFIMEGIPYLSNVKTKVDANLEMDMVKWKFTFKDNEFSLNDLNLGLDGYVLMPDTNIDMDLKFKTKDTDFKSILSLIPAVYSKDFKSVKTSGKLNFDGWAKGRYNASQMPAFACNLDIIDAMFKYPDLPKSVNNINVDIKVKNPTGVLDATTVDVNKFHVEIAGNPVDLAAHIRTPMSDMGITAALKGMIDLSSVKDIMPLEKGDNLDGIIKSDISIDGHMSAMEKKEFDKFKATGMLEIDKMDYTTKSLPYSVKLNTMKLNFTTQYVELPVFDALLGKSDLHATGRIDNLLQYMFKDELIKGSFAITSTLIDLNELMGPETATTAPTETTAAATATSEAVAVPANIDFELSTKIARMVYTNLVLGNMTGNLVIRNQKVDMTDLSMMVIGGKLTLNGYYETSNIKKPTVAMNMRMDGFDIQETFKTFNTIQKLAPIGQYAKGTFTATVENFNTSLNAAMEPDLASVNAKGIVKTKSVSVTGFPPFVKLGEALKMDQLKNMVVQDINANYKLTGGRLVLDPFDTKIAGIPTNITGSTGLDQTIDYRYKMEIPSKMLGGAATGAITGILNQANQKAGTSLALGDKINLAVSIGGTITNPVIKTGMKEGGVAQSAISTVTTQAVNTAIDKAAEEAKKILEDAQREADKLKADNRALADKAKQEGYAEADKLVEQATNPLAKVAAKKAADVAKKKTDEKVQKMIEDGDKKADQIIEDAQKRADAKAAESKK